MQAAVRALYSLNAAAAVPYKVVVAAAGGGLEGVRVLLATEGASSTILECVQPYSREAFLTWCGDGPGGFTVPPGFQFASEAAALALASASLRRAKRLSTLSGDFISSSATRLIGVGLVGALRSEPPRRGSHRCHVAVMSDEKVSPHELILDKTASRSRAAEDAACGRLLLETLIDALGLSSALDSQMAVKPPDRADAADEPYGTRGHRVCSSINLGDPLARLLSCSRLSADEPGVAALSGHSSPLEQTPADPVTHVLFAPSPKADDPTATTVVVNPILPRRCVILPGSFNPLHAGHIRLGAAAIRVAQRLFSESSVAPQSAWEVIFELSAANVDKPPLHQGVVAERIAQFSSSSVGASKWYST